MELFTALVVMDQLDVYSAVPVYPISECTVYSSAYKIHFAVVLVLVFLLNLLTSFSLRAGN